MRLLVDTGSGATLGLLRDTHRHLRPPEDWMPATAIGVGGEIDVVHGRVASLELGDLVVSGPQASFFHRYNVPATRTMRKLNGMLGNGFLSRYRTVIDIAGERLALASIDGEGE